MSLVLIEKSGSIARLTLNRPEQGNALNQAMSDQLLEAAIDVAHDKAIRVVTLTGAGKMFCVGGDVSAFAENSDKIDAFLAKLAGTLHQALSVFASMEKPFITLVNGPAAGAGMSLAISGDIALAAPTAHFTAAYGGIGLTPDGGMSWKLPRLVGLRLAQEIVMTNRRVTAEDAAGIGLVNRVAEALSEEGNTLAEQLSAGAIGAMAASRNLLQSGLQETFTSQLDHERKSICAAGMSKESREGVSAFLERRKPDFAAATAS